MSSTIVSSQRRPLTPHQQDIAKKILKLGVHRFQEKVLLKDVHQIRTPLHYRFVDQAIQEGSGRVDAFTVSARLSVLPYLNNQRQLELVRYQSTYPQSLIKGTSDFTRGIEYDVLRTAFEKGHLEGCSGNLDLIESFCKSIAQKPEHELLALHAELDAAPATNFRLDGKNILPTYALFAGTDKREAFDRMLSAGKAKIEEFTDKMARVYLVNALERICLELGHDTSRERFERLQEEINDTNAPLKFALLHYITPFIGTPHEQQAQDLLRLLVDKDYNWYNDTVQSVPSFSHPRQFSILMQGIQKGWSNGSSDTAAKALAKADPAKLGIVQEELEKADKDLLYALPYFIPVAGTGVESEFLQLVKASSHPQDLAIGLSKLTKKDQYELIKILMDKEKDEGEKTLSSGCDGLAKLEHLPEADKQRYYAGIRKGLNKGLSGMTLHNISQTASVLKHDDSKDLLARAIKSGSNTKLNRILWSLEALDEYDKVGLLTTLGEDKCASVLDRMSPLLRMDDEQLAQDLFAYIERNGIDSLNQYVRSTISQRFKTKKVTPRLNTQHLGLLLESYNEFEVPDAQKNRFYRSILSGKSLFEHREGHSAKKGMKTRSNQRWEHGYYTEVPVTGGLVIDRAWKEEAARNYDEALELLKKEGIQPRQPGSDFYASARGLLDTIKDKAGPGINEARDHLNLIFRRAGGKVIKGEKIVYETGDLIDLAFIGVYPTPTCLALGKDDGMNKDAIISLSDMYEMQPFMVSVNGTTVARCFTYKTDKHLIVDDLYNDYHISMLEPLQDWSRQLGLKLFIPDPIKKDLNTEDQALLEHDAKGNTALPITITPTLGKGRRWYSNSLGGWIDGGKLEFEGYLL